VNGADNAQANVKNPRKSPASACDPPSARIRYGAAGNSWKADTNTVKLNANIVRKRGVNNRLDMGGDDSRLTRSESDEYRYDRAMPARPSQLWKSLSADQRLVAAQAFWTDDESGGVSAEHVEAIAMLARRMNFRAKSMQSLPAERRARLLAQVGDLSDGIAARALIAYHFSAQRPLMAAFLDALGIQHENGLITADEVPPPPADRVADAVRTVRESFPPEDVDLYVRTLSALDAETWAGADPDSPTSA
jgi:hypothetical protein